MSHYPTGFPDLGATSRACRNGVAYTFDENTAASYPVCVVNCDLACSQCAMSVPRNVGRVACAG